MHNSRTWRFPSVVWNFLNLYWELMLGMLHKLKSIMLNDCLVLWIMGFNEPNIIVNLPFLIYSSKEIETFIEWDSLKIFFIWVVSFLNPHCSLFFESHSTISILVIFIVINCIYCVHLSITNDWRVNMIIMKMMIIYSSKLIVLIRAWVDF